MRYAIYFTPAASTALSQFGASAIGYDSATGRDREILPADGMTADAVLDATAEPRRYGFHGTLKPPFELAHGADEGGLVQALEAFAAKCCGFEIPSLKVAALDRFVALVPAMECPEIVQLAGDCVTAFEPFRAPLSESDRARRLAKPLSARQLEHLEQWGYPYIFEEFRFHMTLSGPLDDHTRGRFVDARAKQYSEIAAPLAVDAVVLCQQLSRDARFTVVRRFSFGG
jgi:putative phosphonate metabolism protein